MGTAKMGVDSGLSGGTSVVDADTRVYGTDNLFVVDASILRGLTTSNPSGTIMAVAERASERILALNGSMSADVKGARAVPSEGVSIRFLGHSAVASGAALVLCGCILVI